MRARKIIYLCLPLLRLSGELGSNLAEKMGESHRTLNLTRIILAEGK